MTEIFWLIPFIPAASTLILAIFGKKLPKKYVSFQACFAIFASFVIAVISTVELFQSAHGSFPWVKNLFSWIQAGSFQVNLSLMFDPFPVPKLVHSLQDPHGLLSSEDRQFKAAENILAVDVFPVPRGP